MASATVFTAASVASGLTLAYFKVLVSCEPLPDKPLSTTTFRVSLIGVEVTAMLYSPPSGTINTFRKRIAWGCLNGVWMSVDFYKF
jgi:hypothetical protein